MVQWQKGHVNTSCVPWVQLTCAPCCFNEKNQQLPEPAESCKVAASDPGPLFLIKKNRNLLLLYIELAGHPCRHFMQSGVSEGAAACAPERAWTLNECQETGENEPH